MKPQILPLFLIFLSFVVSGCEGIESEAKYPTGYDRNITGDDIYSERETIFGEGNSLFSTKDDKENNGSSGIGVNSFLWRASLDTVSFMPLASADPFGGVILTDWYSPSETPDERFKLNVFILSKQLRSDAVQVKVFNQRLENGIWRDDETSGAIGREIEDSILTRARQLRIAQIGSVE